MKHLIQLLLLAGFKACDRVPCGQGRNPAEYSRGSEDLSSPAKCQISPTSSPVPTVNVRDCSVLVAWTNADHKCDNSESYIINWYCNATNGTDEVPCGLSAGPLYNIPLDDDCKITVAYKSCGIVGPESNRIPVVDACDSCAGYESSPPGCCKNVLNEVISLNITSLRSYCYYDLDDTRPFAQISAAEFEAIYGPTASDFEYIALNRMKAPQLNWRPSDDNIANGTCPLEYDELYNVYTQSLYGICDWKWGLPLCCIIHEPLVTYFG